MSEMRDGSWRSKVLRPRWPWSSQPVRPADVSDGLTSIMLARENILEDVYYHKIVPNRYIVEVNDENYTRNYQTIARQVTQQWQSKIVEELTTANSRLGRREYAFGGPVQVDIHPAQDLQKNQVRILWQVGGSEIVREANSSRAGPCLELTSGQGMGRGQQWPLLPGTTTLGRHELCDIHLEGADIQQLRLISGQHATIRSEAGGQYRLFDGSPAGKPSANGTFINYQIVPASGHLLQDGDLVILASRDKNHPNPGDPGTASFIYHKDCTGGTT